MSFGPSSPVTGASVTGLTSPTYTLTSMSGPNNQSTQYAVTALGGTQTGVEAHSVSKPFTITAETPANYRALGTPNPVTGVISNIPRNVSKIRTRKGVEVAADQATQMCIIETKLTVPAGADVYDPESVRAAVSAHFGVESSDSAGIADMLIDGIR